MSGFRVAALGGGHGLAVSLAALRRLGIEPTAIVTVADDGGSSGRLRRGLGMLPPGDLRMALLALAGSDRSHGTAAGGAERAGEPAGERAEAVHGRTPQVADLFAYRFGAGDLAGHNLGNLVLAALTDLEGGFLPALEAAARLLDVRGRVLPSTLAAVELHGLVDGTLVEGQAALARATGAIERIWLDPADPPAVAGAVAAVEQADLVLLGPGSTFTSVAPNLLVPGLGAAVAAASERVAYVCNLEPQVGETSGFTPAAHLAALLRHCQGLRVPRVVCQRPPSATQAATEVAELGALGAEVLHADVADTGQTGRHDPERLADALKALL